MANTITYWEPFSNFAGTTVSECDSRIRRFLSLNYEDAKSESEDKILIHASEEAKRHGFFFEQVEKL